MSLPLRDVLAQIEAWYLNHVPAIHATLRPAASDADLNALEEVTGLTLPQAFRTLYQWHDGGDMFGLEFESLAAVQYQWKTWQELAPDFGAEADGHVSHPPGAITERCINTGWLGFLNDGGGNYVGLDFAPGPAGTFGQVITFGRDEEHKYVLADSLDAFLHAYWARLDAGRVTAISLPGYHPERWSVELHDIAGRHKSGCIVLAETFPNFGVAPGILDAPPS